MTGNALIEEGQPAPDFRLKDQNDKLVFLRDFTNRKWVILYFYPKDQTPGCKKEACNFRDNMDRFIAYNVQVLGVNVDNSRSHQAFSNKHHLNFPLLADTTKKVTKAYGALAFYRLPRRMTFVIDPEGRIRKIFSHVNPSNHVEELLAALKELQAK
jgi:peroxiredoxin Q/BCP